MATSMAIGGTTGMTIGLSSSSPIIGGGLNLNGNGSIGSLTPSQTGTKYCTTGGGSATSSVHSPISNTSSTPSNTITVNNSNSGSIGKCPGSVDSNSDIGNSNHSIGSASNASSDIFGSKCKRKINFSNLGMPGRAHQPATVARRNARERNRVKQVNNGFAALKQHIPLGHRSKKMSKVETLRCAVDYIRNLQGMLNIHGSFGSASPAGSSISGDIILIDEENQEQEQQQPMPQHQHQQTHQMNGVNNQRDAYALSSSSSSSPTSSDFGASVAHLPHHLALLQSHHNLQHQHHLANNNNTNNQLRHLSLNHHHLHSSNSMSVATTLIVDSSSNAMTPNSNQLSPTSSEDPSSPYASEASYLNSNGNIKGNAVSLEYEKYEKYEPVSPEDEELLDAIAWWQQS